MNDIDSAPQVVFKTRSVANAATTFVIQMKGWCAAHALENKRASLTIAADQFGNNRTSANLDASVLLLGRVVTSPAGPYPETAGSSLSVSAFQSVVLAYSTGSGFYLGRYVVQRTALRSSHMTYLRASIGRQARGRRFRTLLITAD